MGEGIRVALAPLDLPPRPDVVEVSHGLVWLRLVDGEDARTATKVPAGVYLTSEAWRNASAAFEARGARIRELEAQVASMVRPEECAPVLRPVSLVAGEPNPAPLEVPQPLNVGADGVSTVGPAEPTSSLGTVGLVVGIAGAFVGGLVLGVKLASK